MLFTKNHRYFILLILIFLGFSCTHRVSLEKGEYLLHSQSFKGNKDIPTEELESLIPANQKPNKRLFSLPIAPALWWYDLGKALYNAKKKDKKYNKLLDNLSKLPSDSVFYDAQTARKKIRLRERIAKLQETRNAKIAWFWRNIGEAPSKITNVAIDKTTKNIQAYFFRKGYREASVLPKIDSLENGKIALTYQIAENELYKIDSVKYTLGIAHIDSIILTNSKSALIQNAANFDEDNIIAERVRLETLLKNNGYYLFDKQLIAIKTLKTAVDFKQSKKASINYVLKEIDKPQLKLFEIEEVNFMALDANTVSKAATLNSTIRDFNGIKYTLVEKAFPLRLLDSKIPLRPHQIYSQSSVLETQKQLGILDQFTFANTHFSVINDGKLRAMITAPTLEKYFFTGEITGNTVQDILGGGLSGTLRIRNMLHSLDNLEIGLKFALEGQPAALNLTNQLSREFGANVALNIPQLILPYSIAKKYALKRPRTQLSLGVNYSSQVYRETLNFRFTGNYSWRKSAFETIQISPIDMNLVNTPYKSDAFIAALNAEPTLKVLYEPQFISSINAFYMFNDQIIGQNTKAKYIRFYVESGGSLLNLFSDKDKIPFLDKLIPIGEEDQRNYYRFWKANLDFRKYYPIGKNSSWAYKMNIGVSQSYGKINTMPYQKSFFVGGSNSLRAWSPRSLGPGSSSPDYFTSDTLKNFGRFLPQPGDILLDGSIEYRTRLGRFLVGDMNLGLFLDMGNVWKWYQAENKVNEANFDFSRFYKEIALGTGFGFRWDLSYFVFRYDLGIKIIDPSQPLGQRWVLNRFNFSDPNNAYYRLQSNFAIGMPF